MLKNNLKNPSNLITELDEEFIEKVQKVVYEPKLSLKQLAAYPLATAKGKANILGKAKFPGSYIPRFYEEARKFICHTFNANFLDTDIYFEEFERHAKMLLNEAVSLEKDKRKNKICSSNALSEMRNLNSMLEPILNNFVLNSNLRNTREHLYIQDVKIGCMADILLYENGGLTFTGFMKFNFTKAPLKKREAEYMLYAIKLFFERKLEVNLKDKNCILVDVFAHKLYIAETDLEIDLSIKKSCREIKESWDLITNS